MPTWLGRLVRALFQRSKCSAGVLPGGHLILAGGGEDASKTAAGTAALQTAPKQAPSIS